MKPMMPVTRAEAAVLFEREYQRKCFTQDVTTYQEGTLTCAAIHYAATALDIVVHNVRWPWAPERRPKFTEGDKRRNLEKAAALILAELDRMDKVRFLEERKLQAVQGKSTMS